MDTATTAAPYAIHPAAKPAALLMGFLSDVEDADAPLPPPFDGLPREEFELRRVRAGLKLVGLRQDQLAARLGINEALLSRKLSGQKPTTEVERYLMGVALFVEDRAEMRRIQDRLRGHDRTATVDLAWLAPAQDGGAR